MSYLTIPYILLYLTLKTLPFTLPYVLHYHTLHLTLPYFLPYVLHYLTLFLTSPYHTLTYHILSYHRFYLTLNLMLFKNIHLTTCAFVRRGRLAYAATCDKSDCFGSMLLFFFVEPIHR